MEALNSSVFVITDHKIMFEVFYNLTKNKATSFDFYCSPLSKAIFEDELNKGVIKVLDVKNDYAFLLKNYKMGFSCHAKQIFPQRLVDSMLCINFHTGLNPYNKGCYPHIFSIINGLPLGVTIHIMTKEIDHGAIIFQERLQILEHETAKDVYMRLLDLEKEMLEKHIDSLLSGDYQPFLPEHEGNYNSMKDFKRLCEIDLDEQVSFREAINRLRALSHKPFQNAYFIDENNQKIYLTIELSKPSN